MRGMLKPGLLQSCAFGSCPEIDFLKFAGQRFSASVPDRDRLGGAWTLIGSKGLSFRLLYNCFSQADVQNDGRTRIDAAQ